MTLTKEQKIRKQKLIEETPLKWVSKNVYKYEISENIQTELENLKKQLKSLGFDYGGLLDNIKFRISLAFRDPTGDIFCEIYIPSTLFHELFQYIDNLRIRNGYTGTNEWKRDFCVHYKIPMTGDLAYLDPQDKYWFHDELHNNIS